MTSSSSDVGKISTNNNGDYIIVMNDGKVLTADTTVFTFTLKSKSNVNNVNSLISLSNILGSAGSSVSSKNTSLTVLVKDEGAPRVTFDVKILMHMLKVIVQLYQLLIVTWIIVV